jgi:hypothetical protein
MIVRRLKFAAVPVAVLGVASPMLANCSGGLPELNADTLGDVAGAAEGCPEFEKGDFSSLKLDAKAKGFLEAAAKFSGTVKEIEVELIAACGELGKALDMKDGELKAEPKDGEGAKKVCGAVAAKVDAFFKANADAKITIELTEPKCYADVQAMMDCFGECGAKIDPGKLEASCEGGKISGECSGKCEGSCSAKAGAECKGTCSGSCSGKCDAKFSGQCGGNCKGKCDGQNATGKCAGTCEGSCDAQAEGSCGGKCEGSCDASCEVKATGKCDGECSGKCDAQVKSPKCSGEFKPPDVSIDCQATCAGKAASSFTCDPPGVNVSIKGKANAEVTKVVTGLRKALPKIVKSGTAKAKALGQAGATLATQVKDAAQGIAKAGAKAGVCATVAGEGVASATGALKVNAEVSVNVSASATGKAGGSAGGKAGGGT